MTPRHRWSDATTQTRVPEGSGLFQQETMHISAHTGLWNRPAYFCLLPKAVLDNSLCTQ